MLFAKGLCYGIPSNRRISYQAGEFRITLAVGILPEDWLNSKFNLRLNELFDKSGMTLEELGLKMGFASGTARKAAWGFLKNTSDPRLSTLESLAKALVEVKEFF